MMARALSPNYPTRRSPLPFGAGGGFNRAARSPQGRAQVPVAGGIRACGWIGTAPRGCVDSLLAMRTFKSSLDKLSLTLFLQTHLR